MNSSQIPSQNALKTGIKEIQVAVIASVVTMVFAIMVYMILPRVRHELKVNREALKHGRNYVTEPAGGYIEYVANERLKESVNDQVKEFQDDLGILSRRFQRGEFFMMGIPGSRLAPPVLQVAEFKDQYRFRMEVTGKSAILHVEGRGASVVAFQNYLNYLKKSQQSIAISNANEEKESSN